MWAQTDCFYDTIMQPGHCILDISVGSWGGVGCYLAEHHLDVTVVCILSSFPEFIHAKKFARELEVFDRMEFILAETPEKVRMNHISLIHSLWSRSPCSVGSC